MTAVRDSVTESFEPPMSWLTTGQAVRSFGDAVNDGKSPYGQHPEHYALFAVGYFDQTSGTIEPLLQPAELAQALNLKTGGVS